MGRGEGGKGLKVGIVGGGRLGSSLLRGLLRAGFSQSELMVCEKDEEKAKNLSLQFGVRVVKECGPLLEDSEVIFIAVKPKELEEVLEEMEGKVEGKIVLSCVAGVPLERMEGKLKGARAFRLMPNLACSVGEGAMVYSSRTGGEEERRKVEELLEKLGTPLEVPEEKMNVITALSGSGPAYFSLVIQALAEAAEELGVPRKEALKLASQTAKGTGKMLLELELEPEELIRMVASPGGTTEAALGELEKGKVFEAFKRALKVAWKRAGELG
ncbi:MAG: pyrroline-5-carboxylate reductase [Candidatus Hadarchaeales archaeon]